MYGKYLIEVCLILSDWVIIDVESKRAYVEVRCCWSVSWSSKFCRHKRVTLQFEWRHWLVWSRNIYRCILSLGCLHLSLTDYQYEIRCEAPWLIQSVPLLNVSSSCILRHLLILRQFHLWCDSRDFDKRSPDGWQEPRKFELKVFSNFWQNLTKDRRISTF